ncbi:TetR/AcrR family transcriptional regulator [Ferrimonas sp. SCSIO 43195]|uniref:TetR/AcrR family transcriptional regulator n=1 Tax=Ferrimonas sp. SCSIO 43195 TaxID=2822844 RepID=UPI0020763E08|nr:TetR/AcrR family transcriptional regulator [Ferrimonas sp. SCSIO 43195]USD37318.1 TetR family transcriptional regulator [Ferrimonas sp. SCSIO 43195]
MKCPSEASHRQRCNAILDAAEALVVADGIISFNFSQLAKEVGCSTGTLYRFFERKEDALVCLFLRNATSNHLQGFVTQHPDLTAMEKVLLPVLFTFEMVQRNPSFNALRSVSVNAHIWKLASADKVARLRQRVDHFWNWFHQSVEQAQASGELQASPDQARLLAQGMVFFLTGALTQFESQLVSGRYLGERNDTCFEHLYQLMNQYRWHTPFTEAVYRSLAQQVAAYLQQHYRRHRDCGHCQQLG